jgi:2-pyrone-4,6-dicarboxylate lactonase
VSETVKTYLDNPSTPKLKLPEGAWDAHFHIFGPGDKFPYASTYNQHVADAPKEKLFALHRKLGISRGVFVQSGAHGFDNRAVEDALAANPAYLGVALAPTDVSDAELRRLDVLGFRAVRFNFMPHLGPGAPMNEVLALAKRLAPLNWHLQLHPHASLLGDMMPVLKQSPVPVSFDHMSRIDARAGMNQPGFVNLLKLMEDERFWVKVSGCDRISVQDPPYADAVPYARKLVAEFPDRCVWGTDWPHPNHQPPIPDDGMLVDIIAEIAPSEAQRRKLLVDNPIRLYRPRAV